MLLDILHYGNKSFILDTEIGFTVVEELMLLNALQSDSFELKLALVKLIVERVEFVTWVGVRIEFLDVLLDREKVEADLGLALIDLTS